MTGHGRDGKSDSGSSPRPDPGAGAASGLGPGPGSGPTSGPGAGPGSAAASGPGAGPGPGGGPDPGVDSELRGRFAALRHHEAETAPGFGALWQRAVAARGQGHAGGRHGGLRRRRRLGRVRRPLLAPLAPLTAVVAAVALAALVVIMRPWARTGGLPPAARPQARPAPLITAWRSPTAFLLRTPGEEILSTTPSFGGDLSLGIAAQPRPPRTPSQYRPETHRRSLT
jgi:hypothetical protein